MCVMQVLEVTEPVTRSCVTRLQVDRALSSKCQWAFLGLRMVSLSGPEEFHSRFHESRPAAPATILEYFRAFSASHTDTRSPQQRP